MSAISTSPAVVDAAENGRAQATSYQAKAAPSNVKNQKDFSRLGREIAHVKHLHAAVVAHGHGARAKALQIGEVLTGIKESLEHGQWLPWLTSNLPDITPRTAQNYMRVWKNRELIKNESNSYLVENLTAALGAVSKQEKDNPDTADNNIDANPAKGSSERSHKRELLRDLGAAFIAGLETEEVNVLELVARRLPDWRPGLLEAARREIAEAATGTKAEEIDQLPA